MAAEIFNLKFAELPEGWMALEGVLLVKCLDESGHVRYIEAKTHSLTNVEALGMTSTFEDTLRTVIMQHGRHME